MITPDFIGQIYKDTNTGNLWRANSLTPGDLTIELQNSNFAWLPTGTAAGGLIGIVTGSGGANLPGITSITITEAIQLGYYYIDGCDDLVTISAPNLTNTNPFDTLWISNNAVLTTISLPVLEHCDGSIHIANNASLTSLVLTNLIDPWGLEIVSNILLTSISLPAATGIWGGFSTNGSTALTSISAPNLIDIDGTCLCTNCPNLSSLSLASWVPDNGRVINFTGSALNVASVDLVLARCVANAGFVTGTVTLNGGTVATPSGAGLADKATLIARGVSVTTN